MRVLQVENGSFTPSVFSINERMGKEAPKCYSQIDDMLYEKRDKNLLDNNVLDSKKTIIFLNKVEVALEVAEHLNRTKENNVHQKLQVIAKGYMSSNSKLLLYINYYI